MLNWAEHEMAIADYDQAIELDPHHLTAYNNRGLANSISMLGDHHSQSPIL